MFSFFHGAEKPKHDVMFITARRLLSDLFNFLERNHSNAHLENNMRILLSRTRFDEFPTKEKSLQQEVKDETDLFLLESVCLVWKHNPLEHETLEGKPEKRGNRANCKGSSVTAGERPNPKTVLSD